MRNNIILKISLVTVLSGFLISSPLEIKETDNNKNTNNEIDDTYIIKGGWNLYNDARTAKGKNELKKEPLSKKIELDLLQKILDENRKQTKIQEKILALLEEEIDPQAKEVTVNGKKCIANSSAECFVYPMIAEAKRVPVMAEFLKDPYEISKAGEYLKWQAKLFNHAANIGNSLQFAYSQWGEKVYPVGAMTPSYSSATGIFEGKILPAAQKKLIIEQKNISYSIFIGKNITVDIYSALSIADIIREYKTLDFELVFVDQRSKDVFEAAVASVYNMDMFPEWSSVKKTIDSKKFEAFGIKTSPAFVLKQVKENNKKKAQTILTGKIDEATFRNRIISYFELNKLINYEEFSERSAWNVDEAKTFVKDFYKSTKNTDITNLLIDKKENK